MSDRHRPSRPPEIGGRLQGDGWLHVLPGTLPGWDSHDVEVTAVRREGQVRLTGLRLTPRAGVGDEEAALTHARIRSLPLHRLAQFAVDMLRPTDEAMWGDLATLADPIDTRARGTVEQAAAIWRLSRKEGRSPRLEIQKRFGVGERAAFRYLQRARSAGLIPTQTLTDENEEGHADA